MAAFVSAFAGRSLLSAANRRAAVVCSPPAAPGVAVAQLQKPPPRPSANPPPPRPSSGGDNNNKDGPAAAAPTPPAAPAAARGPAAAAPGGNGTAAASGRGPPRGPPPPRREGGGGGAGAGGERPQGRREGGPPRRDGGGGPRGGGAPRFAPGGYRTGMTRTQPDPVVSPRGAPPSEAGARGGGGAPTGYSSERGRASREAASDRGPPRGERPPRAVGGIQYTTCSNCKATYIMTPESLTAGGGVGAKVRCAVCKHVWFQKADRLNALAPGLGMKDYPEDRKEVIAQGGDFRQERPPMGDRPPRGGPGGDRRGGPGGERGGYSSARGGGERRPYGGGGGGDRRGGRSSSKTTVFVGNLPFAASEAELRDLLTSTGAGVSKVTMVSDQDGRPKGFAFAEMATEADMRSVVDGLDGASLGGRNVSVREGNK